MHGLLLVLGGILKLQAWRASPQNPQPKTHCFQTLESWPLSFPNLGNPPPFLSKVGTYSRETGVGYVFSSVVVSKGIYLSGA